MNGELRTWKRTQSQRWVEKFHFCVFLICANRYCSSVCVISRPLNIVMLVMLLWVYILTGQAWKICLTTVGIEPTTFGYVFLSTTMCYYELISETVCNHVLLCVVGWVSSFMSKVVVSSVREPPDKMFDDFEFGSDMCIVMSVWLGNKCESEPHGENPALDYTFPVLLFIHYSGSPFNIRASSPGLGYILIYIEQSYSYFELQFTRVGQTINLSFNRQFQLLVYACRGWWEVRYHIAEYAEKSQ
jgi:hypothetical protein